MNSFTIYGTTTGTNREESDSKAFRYLPSPSPGGDPGMEPRYGSGHGNSFSGIF